MPKEKFRGFKLCKEEIINLQVDRLLLGIAKEAKERGGLGAIQGKIFIESIDGYNDDPRELWEIPEAKRYFKKLDEVAPFFLYFIANEIFDKGVRLYLKMFINPAFFTDPNLNKKTAKQAGDFVGKRIHAIVSYCKEINMNGEVQAAPRETIYQIYKCMGYDISREKISRDMGI